jgi:hypothetical protein
VNKGRTAVVAAATGLVLVWLASGLPPGAFFSGDSGVKLIAALDAIAHPSRPFETDLPRVGTRTATFVDQMVLTHGEHAHVLQSPLFPPLTAPLISLFGLRGAYVWPALAFAAMFPLLAVARRHLVPETSRSMLAWMAIAASPLLFYALEFWEHAPAVALLTAATATVAPALAGGGSPIRVAAGGALLGAGVLLRLEGIWYGGGLALALGPRWWLPFGAGAAALLLPAAAANHSHFGNPLGAHASAVLAPIATGFVAARVQRIEHWVLPGSVAAAAGLALVAASWAGALVKLDVRARQMMALAGTAIVAVLAARRTLPIESFLQGFPLALLAFVPAVTSTREAGRLALATFVTVVGVLLTATNDGGAQWGTRYLLIAAPPLLLLAARGATDAAGQGALRWPRLAALVVILLAGAATSRAAYLELRGAKRSYEGLVAAVAGAVPPGGVIVTNAWWLDQIAAALHRSRTFLYVPDEPAAARAFALLQNERIEHVTVAWSEEEPPFRLEAVLDRTCFRIGAVREIPLRAMRLAPAHCPPGGRAK